MSGFLNQDAGIAASVFLALYTVYLGFCTYIVFKNGFMTVYTSVWFFTLMRFGGQLCGVVYAKLGPAHYQWLIAYLVLGAEGYFTLIFAAFQFTCRAQIVSVGSSWIKSLGPKKIKVSRGLGFITGARLINFFTETYARMFHFILIPANAMVISGGSMLAGVSDLETEKDKVQTSKILRTVGQSLFLAMTMIAILMNIYVYVKERIRSHFTISIMIASPFLMVRGIFGILSIYITAMNYFEVVNYVGTGLGQKLVVYEYCLSTLMELVASVALMSNYFFDKSTKALDEDQSSLEK